MKKNVPDIIRRKMVISLGRLENETAWAPSAYDCLVAGHWNHPTIATIVTDNIFKGTGALIPIPPVLLIV